MGLADRTRMKACTRNIPVRCVLPSSSVLIFSALSPAMSGPSFANAFAQAKIAKTGVHWQVDEKLTDQPKYESDPGREPQ